MDLRTAAGLWDNRVRATPEAPALARGKRQVSYREMDMHNRAVARRLLDWGAAPGMRVALLLPSNETMLHLLLALARIGAVAVPVVAQSTTDEVVFVLRHANVARLVTDAAGLKTLRGSQSLPDSLPEIATVDGSEGFPELDARNSTGERLDVGVAAPEPQMPVSILYTSGSTGRPKGVVLPQSSFATAGAAIADRLGYTSSDTIICPLPLFHAAAPLMNWAPAVHAGATFTLIPRFSASTFWDEADSVGATATLVVPTIPSILAASEPRQDDRDHSLRLLVTHRYMPDFVARFGVAMCTIWGMTETGTLGVMTAPGQEPAENLVGHPYPPDAKVRIIDAGQSLGPGETGELWFHHEDVMLRYHDDPVATEDTLVDGWIRSGDLARTDAAGNVYFVGRVKNMIKRSGENVSAEEVEARLLAHPDVAEAAVIGVPDPIRAEEVYARVVCREGVELDAEEIWSWCQATLSDFKVPRFLQIDTAPLPRLRTEKVNLKAIRDMADPDTAYDRLGG